MTIRRLPVRLRPGLPTLAALALLLSACDDPSAPAGDVYTLVSIGGALPGPIPVSSPVEATTGALEITSDERWEQSLTLRCRGDESCVVPEAWGRMTGRLDRSAGPGHADGVVRWAGGIEAVVVLEAGAVLLSYPLPPSHGLGSVTFRFER